MNVISEEISFWAPQFVAHLSQALYPNYTLDSCLFWKLIHPFDHRTATTLLGEENYLSCWHFASIKIIANLLYNVKHNLCMAENIE